MKRMVLIVLLWVVPFMVLAEATNAPRIESTTTVASNPDETTTWKTVMTSLGVVGGVIVADLFMGGSLTSSLIGWGANVAPASVVYSPEVLSARAAGAVLGEMITPATNLRDVAARRDMFYVFMLGVGGAVGAVVTSLWARNTLDNDVVDTTNPVSNTK